MIHCQPAGTPHPCCTCNICCAQTPPAAAAAAAAEQQQNSPHTEDERKGVCDM